jgi:UPF0755 protein
MAADKKSKAAPADPKTKPAAGKGAASKALKTAPPASPAMVLEPKRAPERPPGKGKTGAGRKPEWRFVRTLSSLMTALMLAVVGVSGTGFFINAQYEARGPLEAAKGFVVPKGKGRLDIAERLEHEGIIANRWTFTLGQMLQTALGARKGGELKAGSYEFKAGTSMRDVVDVLVDGKSVAAKITIPEGLTSQQIVERLKGSEALQGDIAAIPAEGSLLPDTYVFTRGTARQDLIERMQAEHTKFVAAAWDKRTQGLPFQTLQQALTMASIVEKETGRSDEREKVAAVFVNRLRKNMRLQSDPTIIYGIAGGQGALGRPILRSDIDQKTAYNTYQIDGLPPTPISNPGKLAIEATLNPAQTNDIYFVADGTGGHAFSETLKDHNAAVANWRKIEKEAKAAKAAQAAAVPVAASAPASAAPGVAPSKLNGPAVAPAATVAVQAPDAVPVMKSDVPETEPATAPALASTANVPLPVRKPKK